MSRDVRAPALAAFASLLTILVLSPLLADRSWLQPVLLIVVAVGLAGAGAAAAGVPRPLIPVATSVVALVITTALLVPAQAAVGGFVPTPGSLRALLVLLRAGVQTSNVVAPPAPLDAGLIALLSCAAAVLTVLVATVAGPLRRPGAAGLPLLLVVCVATALAPRGIGLQGYLLAGVGYLALALTDADERVNGWGQVLGRGSDTRHASSSGIAESLVRPAVVVSLVALVVGGLVPLTLPGRPTGLLQSMVDERFGSGGSDGLTTVNPYLDIRKDLESQSETPVLRYTTEDDDPDPLRILTADEFDGAVWRPSEIALDPAQEVGSGLPAPPGTSAEVLAAASQVLTTVDIDRLDQSYLPLPYPASSVEVPGSWLYDAATLNVVATEGSTVGLRYAVSSYDIDPTSAQLAGAPSQAIDARWTAVPAEVRDVVLPVAQEILATANAVTTYDQALALQQWFRSRGGFRYTLDAPDTTDREAVSAFLEDRQGYCVQFASTMTLMARSLGIPARIAVGFLPGEEVEPGQWLIRASDAHAWPELYFEGTGWVRFEPTPGTRTGAPPSWAIPESNAAVPAPDLSGPSAAPVPQPLPQEQGATTAPQEGSSRPGVGEVLGYVGLAGTATLLLGGLLFLSRWWRGLRSARRWRRSTDDAELARIAWLELQERLADLGVRLEGPTIGTQGEELVADRPFGHEERAAVARLVAAAERASYASSTGPVDGLRADLGVVLAATREQLPTGQQRRATWWPALRPRTSGSSGLTPVRERERV